MVTNSENRNREVQTDFMQLIHGNPKNRNLGIAVFYRVSAFDIPTHEKNME